MGETLRKVVAFFSMFGGSGFSGSLDAQAERPPAPAEPRMGGYRVDYSMPTQEEIQAHDPALDELFANSKVISHNSET